MEDVKNTEGMLFKTKIFHHVCDVMWCEQVEEKRRGTHHKTIYL